MKQILHAEVLLSGATLAQSSVLNLKKEEMTYLYTLYGIAIIAAFTLFFWNRIGNPFSARPRVTKSPENATPPKPVDTSRMSIALNKWIETEGEEPAKTLPAVPPLADLVAPPVEADVDSWTRPEEQPSEASASSARSASSEACQ